MGAYGFRLQGIEASASQLVDAPAHWPAIELRVRISNGPFPSDDRLDADTAAVRLRAGGSVTIDRATGLAILSLPAEPHPASLLHPHLAPIAAIAAHWRGRESFHGGAFLAGGGVWCLLGDKGAGKSSTLAALAATGIPVICDDVLVLDGRTALAGPRSIDLRADAARRLGVGESLGVIGERERWRLALAQVEPELPLHGWIRLDWGTRTDVRELRGAERLEELLRHRALRVAPADPGTPMELCSLPFLELSRPRGWSSIDAAIARLLAAVGG